MCYNIYINLGGTYVFENVKRPSANNSTDTLSVITNHDSSWWYARHFFC